MSYTAPSSTSRFLAWMFTAGLLMACGDDQETKPSSTGGTHGVLGVAGAATGGGTAQVQGGSGTPQAGTSNAAGAATGGGSSVSGQAGAAGASSGGALTNGGSDARAGSAGTVAMSGAPAAGGSPAGSPSGDAGGSAGGESSPAGAGGSAEGGTSAGAGPWALGGSAAGSSATGGSAEGGSATGGVTVQPNVACGNGVADAGEECDDGNDRDSDGCTRSCRYGCRTVVECGDDNPCTVDTCAPAGAGWACSHVVEVDATCEDGNECTIGDRCSSEGQCAAGTNACACQVKADCASFEDGNLCNGTLDCVRGRCEVDATTVVTCNTSEDTDCRRAVCDPSTGTCSAVNQSDGRGCDDGLFCTQVDVCSGGTCVGSGDPCLAHACAEGCDDANRRCTASSSARRCRAAAGLCDVPEQCDGVQLDCPQDARVAPGTVCRGAAGPCDAVEVCNGMAASCPGDALRANGTVCREARGACDEPEVCDGASTGCPSDGLVVAGSVCRPAAGDCDLADQCTGSDPECPLDARKASGTVCRSPAGTCDTAETCDGAAAQCPADQLAPATTVCRPATGVCDVTERCGGTSAACPEDAFQALGTACNDGNACSSGDACNGLGSCTVSSTIEPRVPAPLWPTAGWLTGSIHAAAERLVQRPELRWRPLADDGCGSVTYQVEVDDSCEPGTFRACGFPSPEASAVSIAATSWRPEVNLPVSSQAPVGRRYYWRVRACRNGSCSSWSEPRYLEVGRVANDLDGDGYSEIVVGAPEKDGMGGVLVYGGNATTGSAATVRELVPPTPDAGQRFGAVLASGDLNADGFADLAVSAPALAGSVGATEGAVLVYLGRATGLAAVPEYTVVSPSPQAAARFGSGLAGETDVNGDGYSDLAVGAPGQDTETADSGILFVFPGGSPGPNWLDPWRVANPSAEAGAGFGDGVAGGDLTNDGFGDLALASSGARRLNVLLGAASGLLPQSPANVVGNLTIAQGSIALGGDHDADGWPNLVVGMRSWCCYGNGIYPYNGSDAGLVGQAGWGKGVYYPDEFGYALGNGGDFNGDGRFEIVAGTPGPWNGGPGFLEIGQGSASGVDVLLRLDNPAGVSGGRYAEALTTRSDVNGDGYSDLVVGAPEQNYVYLYLGRSTGIGSTPDRQIVGTGKLGRGLPR